MKTKTPGLLGANWQRGRGVGGVSPPQGLPVERPAGEITRTARLATSSAQIPERNGLSRRGGRVTAPGFSSGRI